ncbi:MAG TPA: flagellar biosynthetic protein FliR, partial [Candidatus Binatia bacterium]|nr:flagellar biosynthetic protein FliR [Candidatus Binatia bacterium]
AGQAIGLQAGYSYASTIDPNTQADSSVLVLMAQLLAGLLFFSLGFEREITKILAKSLVRFPPGSYKIDGPIALTVISLGKEIFREGLRLALPVIALLLLIDLALGMLSRVQTQLQLLTLAFPVKMLVAILVLTSSLVLFPSVFARSSSHVLSTLLRLASH